MLTDIVFAIVISILCIPTSVQDWHEALISEVLCWILLFTSWIAWILNGRSVVSFFMLMVITVLFVLNKEFRYVGDADLLCVAMYFGVFAHYGLYSPISYIYPISLLYILIPYAEFYANSHGFEWKLFSGIMMPAFPLIAAGWWVATPSFIIYSLLSSEI